MGSAGFLVIGKGIERTSGVLGAAPIDLDLLGVAGTGPSAGNSY